MYWEGGALPLTLSGQPRSITMRTHITFGVSGRRPAIHPILDRSSDMAGGPCVRGWRSILCVRGWREAAVPCLEVPSRPGSTSSLCRAAVVVGVGCPVPGELLAWGRRPPQHPSLCS